MAIVTSNATFLHIPKCGGLWVVKAMSAAGLPVQVVPAGCQHAIAATEGRFVFTFVRHPLTWYQSFWKFRCNQAKHLGESIEEQLRAFARQTAEPIDACLIDERGRPRSFAGFVEQCMACYPGFLSEKYALYSAKANFVGRQESLCADLLTALGQAGNVFDAAAIRGTPKVNEGDDWFDAAYPPGLADRVRAAEAAAIETFYSGTTRIAA